MRRSFVVLVAAALLGPALMLGKCVLQPAGDEFPAVSPRVAASVVLLSMDDIGALELAAYDPALPGQPAVRELARVGVTCHLAFGATDSTPAAVTSLLTGQLPSTHGVLGFQDRLDPAFLTLAEAFAHRGFRTAAFTNLPLFSLTGLGDGFEVARQDLAADARALGAAAGQWLAGLGDVDFFLWVHVHRHAARPGGVVPAAGPAFDQLTGGVLAGLRMARLLERSYVVACGTFAGPAQKLVTPMLWRIPRRYAGGADRIGPCSTLDVAPTLLETFDMAGFIPTPSRSLLGEHKSLITGFYFDQRALVEWFEPGSRSPVFGLRTPQFALAEGPAPGAFAVFDLENDPRRRNDLLGTEAGDRIRDGLAAELRERRARLPPPRAPLPAPLDEAGRARLEALGIIDP